MPLRIILTGSYNGQDSLGDECLVKCVVERVRHLRPDATVDVQLHGVQQTVIQDLAHEQDLEVNKGLQSAMWRMSHVLGRLGIPRAITEASTSRGIGLAARIGLFGANVAMDRLRCSDIFIIYGGTQFSGQWFRLNAPAYLRSAEIVRSTGGRVFFGPQQYGPLSSKNTRALRSALNNFVHDWRTRNDLDANQLEPDPAKRPHRVLYDEVFSNTRLYPTKQRREARHILLNLRQTTFDTDDTLNSEQFLAITHMMDRISVALDLPVLFYAVSNASFCDDDATLAVVRRFSNAPERYTSVGRVKDEFHLLELARKAAMSVSMSFHGCILAGIGGVPFVPITEGQYYDYKYADFDKYSANQGVPLISLSRCNPEHDADACLEYAQHYHPEAFDACRVAASNQIDDLYARWLEVAS